MIAPRAVKTWSVAVPRVARLLVPISTEALVVRDAGPRSATASRRKGVHLHWALPDALTRGRVENGQLVLPPIPDRWLVLRLSPGPDGRRDVKGWVLASGDAKPSVVDLDRWSESGKTAQGLERPLTVLGSGDPTWTARFDDAENRLAFHDALEGVTKGPLAYLVCGWHADPASDPLGGPDAHVTGARMERLHELGWSAPGLDVAVAVAHAASFRAAARAAGLAADDPPNEPMLSLYHGALVDVGWPDAGVLETAEGLPNPDQIKVVLGSTIAEALAVATDPAAPPIRSRLMQLVLAQVGSVLDAADGRARADAELHAKSFVSYPGGTAIETVWEPPPQPQPTPPGHGPRPPIAVLDGREAAVLASEPAAPGRPPRVPPRFQPVRAVRRESAFDAMTADPTTLTLAETVASVTPPSPTPSPSQPGRFVQVERPLPPFHAPADPVLLVQGAHRAFRHGGDGRFSTDGTLVCRTSGTTVTATVVTLDGRRFAARAESALARGVENGSVPAECDALLHELVLLDPGSAPTLARTMFDGAGSERVVRALKVEQTAWWALRDPRVDPAPLLVHSGVQGTLPSPQAVSPPLRSWTPLYAEWQAEYQPSANGTADWSLGELDFAPHRQATGTPIPVSGRALLSAAPSKLAADAARHARLAARQVGTSTTLPAGHVARFASDIAGALASELAGLDQVGDGLSDLVGRLEDTDLLAGALAPLRTDLRGGIVGDGASVPESGAPPPSPFVALRAGFLRLTSLRIVDGFGQSVVLDPSKVVLAGSLAVDGHPERAALPPRFTSPARLNLRFVDANGAPTDADDVVTPVCGFVVPNHLEDAAEIFDARGDALGVLRQEDTLLWEPAPGVTGTAGRAPERTIANPFLAGVVRGLLDHGSADSTRDERALGAFLRAVDATAWSVDPFAHAGDEHLSLLVGHPIAVVRARLWLEVDEPVAPDASGRPFEVKLGSLAHWQDGLLGYYVDDDYRRLHLPDGAAARYARELAPGQGFLQRIDRVGAWFSSFATDLAGDPPAGRAPIEHPVIGTEGVLSIRPGQIIRLTLLVEPHATVRATSGLLPQIATGLRRRWMAPGLARIAPTFRFGPLLVDPNSIRMPVARDVGGTWSWVSRASAGIWDDAPVTTSPGDASISADRPRVTEGWLKLVPDPPAEDG